MTELGSDAGSLAPEPWAVLWGCAAGQAGLSEALFLLYHKWGAHQFLVLKMEIDLPIISFHLPRFLYGQSSSDHLLVPQKAFDSMYTLNPTTPADQHCQTKSFALELPLGTHVTSRDTRHQRSLFSMWNKASRSQGTGSNLVCGKVSFVQRLWMALLSWVK